jgi:hypothetical protein
MLRRSLWCPISLLLIAGAVQADTDAIVNDRNADPILTAQYAPKLALVHTSFLGNHLVCAWEQRSATSREYRVAVSADVGFGTLTWVQHGSPPAPAGYSWLSDMWLKAPEIFQSFDGTFLIVGQVRTNGGSPFTTGLASVRGHVQDENTLTWETPQVIETFGTQVGTSRYLMAVTLNTDEYGTAYVGYVNLNTDHVMKGAWFRRSFDLGTNWSAPLPSGIDSSGAGFAVPTFQPSNGGGLVMFWGTPDGQIHTKSSFDSGTSFGTPVPIGPAIVRDMNSPGRMSLSWGQISTGVDRYGLSQGLMFFAAATEVDHSSYSFPNLFLCPEQNEVEPNSQPLTATSFLPQSVIRGSFAAGSPPDTDCYAVSLAQGQTIMALQDSTATNLFTNLTLRGPDGTSILTDWVDRMEFTAPIAGTYYLIVAQIGTLGGGYRIRTATGSPPGGGSRDQHDVFVTHGFPSGGPSWSPSVNASASVAPAGYDEDGITFTGNRDGFLYMTWYDWSTQAAKAISRFAVVRSADGGQTWQGPKFLSSSATDWRFVQWPPNAAPGAFQDVAADPTGAYYVWIDGRNGDPDIYSRAIRRSMAINSAVPTSFIVHPGDNVNLSVAVQNGDDVWEWNPAMLRAEPRNRNWYLPGDYFPLAAGATQNRAFSFTVPDTAAPGDVTMDITLHSGVWPETGYNPSYGFTPITVTVLAPVGVEGGAARLELSPVAPNPAIASANLAFSLSRAGHACLSIHDVGGRLVRVLADGALPAGRHVRQWNGADDTGARVASGAYFEQLEAEGRRLVRRLVWMR